MANFLYVDNSNIWIEGMHVAAVADGLAPNIWVAQEERITSPLELRFWATLRIRRWRSR